MSCVWPLAARAGSSSVTTVSDGVSGVTGVWPLGSLLICDGCDAGYHLDCLEPPLS